MALFAGLSIPIGDDEFTSDKVDPSLGAFWSYSAGMDWFGTVLLSETDDDVSISNGVVYVPPFRPCIQVLTRLVRSR